MSKSEPAKDGFYSKIFVSTIVVIWVSLVGGNWLGHYAVEKGLLGKNQKTEYKAMTNQKPKPWVTVDPKQVEAVEQMTGQRNAVQPATSSSPEETPAAREIVTSTPINQDEVASPKPSEEVKPTPKAKLKPSNAPTPSPVALETPGQPPEPTPAVALANHKFQLQFGSFSTQENAQRMADELARVGQPAKVEEIEAGHGKVYRVRGGTFSEEEARLQRDKLKEQQIDAYIVDKS